ncbi:MAG: hypothetical protein AAF570_18860, partial [Bacteroidota bacterium]
MLSLFQATNAQTFTAEYGLAAEELRGRSVTATADGGMAIASLQQGTLSGDNIHLSLLDKNGNVLGRNTLNLLGGSAGFETPTDIVQTVDGGYIIAGTRNHLFGSDVFLLKVDRNFTGEWGKIYTRNGGGDEVAYEVIQTADLGYALVGSAEDPSIFGGVLFEDMMVLKTDRDGNLMYATTLLTTTRGQYGRTITQTKDGGYIVAGAVRETTGGTDPMVVKLDEDLNLEYARRHVHPNSHGEGVAIEQNEDGSYMMAGEEAGHVLPSSSTYFLTRINPYGGIQWSNAYGDLNDKYTPLSMMSTEHAIYISGIHSDDNATGQVLQYLTAIDRNGLLVDFNRSFAANTWGGYATRLNDGTFALVGDNHISGPVRDELVVTRADFNGRVGGCDLLDIRTSVPLAWTDTDITTTTNPQSTAADWTTLNQNISAQPQALLTSPPTCVSSGCLPDDFDPALFTVIDATNQNFNTDRALSGKYLVTEDIFVIDGITDITNCDLVFAEGTKLVVAGDAELRAYNSVFRSCDPNSTWTGIEARNDSRGSIEGCVFRNAKEGFFAALTEGYAL